MNAMRIPIKEIASVSGGRDLLYFYVAIESDHTINDIANPNFQTLAILMTFG